MSNHQDKQNMVQIIFVLSVVTGVISLVMLLHALSKKLTACVVSYVTILGCSIAISILSGNVLHSMKESNNDTENSVVFSPETMSKVFQKVDI